MIKPHRWFRYACRPYQHGNYIKEALDGILMQKTDFPVEILIGEDGSTDGTREICMDYSERYPDRIRLFFKHPGNRDLCEGPAYGPVEFFK